MGLCEGGATPTPRAWNAVGRKAEPKCAPKDRFIVCNDSVNSCNAAAGEVIHG